MDISRIEAYNPNRIDWKRLTAKEIMQYQNRGVEVPNVYLQWAHDFLNTVEAERNDDVTYEAAEAQARNQTTEHTRNSNGEVIPSNKNSIDGSEDSDNNKNDEKNITPQVSIPQSQNQNNGEQTKNPQKPESISEIKEKFMQKEGVVGTGSKFAEISEANVQLASNASNTSETVKNSSSNQIEQLEQDMENIMSKIEEAESKIKEAAQKSNEKGYISETANLKAEIKSMGITAQTKLGSGEAEFLQHDQVLIEQGSIGTEVHDFGKETVSLGEKIKRFPLLYGFGQIVINAGNRAVSAGDKAIEAQSAASDTNQDSLIRTIDLEKEIRSSTGVSPESQEKTENDYSVQKTENSQNPIRVDKSEEKFESEKMVKISQNDGSDSTDKANTDIDEIIKRKIRRGENLG